MMACDAHHSVLIWSHAGERSMKHLEISREALDAYEKRTGFSGIGRFLTERGYVRVKERRGCRKEQ
jgi:hypothetical protein